MTYCRIGQWSRFDKYQASSRHRISNAVWIGDPLVAWGLEEVRDSLPCLGLAAIEVLYLPSSGKERGQRSHLMVMMLAAELICRRFDLSQGSHQFLHLCSFNLTDLVHPRDVTLLIIDGEDFDEVPTRMCW